MLLANDLRDSPKLLKSIEQVIAIIRRIGNASDSHGVERDLFQQILSTAKQIFDADVVILHPSKQGEFDTTLPMKLGTLRYEKLWYQQVTEGSLIDRILASDKDLFFFLDAFKQDLLVNRPRASVKIEDKKGFAVRENIASSLAIRIHTGQLTRGVLFLNYKKQAHTFNQSFMDLVRAFADLVSLCIEISHLYKGAIQIAEELHTEIIPQLIRGVMTDSGLGCVHLSNKDYEQTHNYLLNIEAASQQIVCALGDVVRRLITNFTPMDSFITEGSS